MEAFEENEIDAVLYAQKSYDVNDFMPWDHLNYLIDKRFLWGEYQKALEAVTTPNCRQKCSLCGIKQSVGCQVYNNSESGRS